jgi:hypothetical protein
MGDDGGEIPFKIEGKGVGQLIQLCSLNLINNEEGAFSRWTTGTLEISPLTPT